MASIIRPSFSARLAPRTKHLLEDKFVCRQCMHQQSIAQPAYRSTKQTPFLQAFKQPGHYRVRYNTTAASPSILSSAAHEYAAAAQTAANASKKSFPATSSKSVAYWLLASAGSVFGIVVFGGLTRLTESGLSITEWRPVTGSLPPRNEQIWEEEFARYKLSPEFKMLNSRMDLEDFKKIYWMEWTHRLWGRVVGITFLVPTAYFIARKRVSKPMAFKLVGICGLIGFQGFLGWWMVKSGLKDDLFAPGSHPRVSQYRLAAHLGTAFIAYIAMLWNGLRILHAHKLLADPAQSSEIIKALADPRLRAFKTAVAALSVLVFTTAMSGALVAGLDAGLIYNDFPWMGQGLLPPKKEMLDPFYSHTPSQDDLVWRNMLENPVLVQLDHRVLATSTFVAVLGLWAYSRAFRGRTLLKPSGASKAALGLVHLVCLQVTLGITTLWYLVPTPLASAHQAGALALLSGIVVLANRTWAPKRAVKMLQQASKHAVRVQRTTTV